MRPAGARVVVAQQQAGRRPFVLLASFILIAAGGAAIALSRRSAEAEPKAPQPVAEVVESPCTRVSHPNLSHLRGPEGKEVLLIGTLPLDLDGVSKELVNDALKSLRPDVVMVEGTWAAGVNAMFLSGRWSLHGQPLPAGSSSDWSDVGNVAPVEMPKARRRFLGLLPGPDPPWPERSIVPVKVGYWANHLRALVGREVAAAVTTAAADGVPLHFLGPAEGGYQGHMQVSMLAQQAAGELLEEEVRRGQMPSAEVDAALRRAETRVREDARRWLEDGRAQTEKSLSLLQEHAPPEISEQLAHHMESRVHAHASAIRSMMEGYQRAAVVISVDQLTGVERKLLESGYEYVSNTA